MNNKYNLRCQSSLIHSWFSRVSGDSLVTFQFRQTRGRTATDSQKDRHFSGPSALSTDQTNSAAVLLRLLDLYVSLLNRVIEVFSAAFLPKMPGNLVLSWGN